MELAHGGEGVEEAGVGVELAVEDPGDDGVGAGEQRILVLVRRAGPGLGGGGGGGGGLLPRLRHWWSAGLRLGLGFGAA